MFLNCCRVYLISNEFMKLAKIDTTSGLGKARLATAKITEVSYARTVANDQTFPNNGFNICVRL